MSKTKQSEWMKGLLAAEEMRQEGYSDTQLRDYIYSEGFISQYWLGFAGYLYNREEGLI